MAVQSEFPVECASLPFSDAGTWAPFVYDSLIPYGLNVICFQPTAEEGGQCLKPGPRLDT